jgi:adsorption protein B
MGSWVVLEVVPYILLFTQVLLGFVGLVFLLSGIDDLFIDLNFLIRASFRRLFVLPRYKRLSVEDLRSASEKAIAIMVPAWDESAVIRRMVQNTLRTLEYSNYHVFVGTYPNDADTAREVDEVAAAFPNVHRTVCPKDGPTNKADCLNWIYQGIRLYEKENEIRFEIFVMEDCEDIVHPLSLKLFNWLIPRVDMVQLPVFPLETRWHDFVSGHYIDEFAENHTKDLWVRERLTNGIPAAGVGCAFSRQAIERFARERNNQLFNIESLTEDYEFGLRLRTFTLKGIFVRQRLEVPESGGGRPKSRRPSKAARIVAVREYFPSTFQTAVRQKSRWVLGITLQGWSNLGWRGDFWTRYMYLRDRKTLVTSLVNVLGYVVVVIQVAIWTLQFLFPSAYRFPPLVEPGGFLWNLLNIDAIFLANRLAWRIFSVGRVYGFTQALLSIPRQICANFINAAAVLRALAQYAQYLRTGSLLKWDKTAHVFPTEAELAVYHQKLGDLLIQRGLISAEQLDAALSWQQQVKRPLGSLLVRMGALGEAQLTETLAAQLHLPVEKLDPRRTPAEVLGALPRRLAVRYSVFPVRVLEDGRLLLATADRLKPRDLLDIETTLGRKVALCLVTRSDLGLALRLGYGLSEEQAAASGQGERVPPQSVHGYRRLGEILVEEEMVPVSVLEAAVEGYATAEPQLFGEYLLRIGVISPEQLHLAMELQSTCGAVSPGPPQAEAADSGRGPGEAGHA